MTSKLLVSNFSVGGPTFLFGNGGVANNAATFFSGLGETASGPASQWYVSEWSLANYINPANVVVDGSNYVDPLYGAPVYDFSNSDGSHNLAAYQAADGSWVYGLTADNDSVGNAVGGADLFLSATLATPITLNNTVNYQVDLRETAAISGTAPDFAFTGFSLNFNVAGTSTYNAALPTISMFLQIDITDSRGASTMQDYDTASVSADGKSMTLVAAGVLPGDPSLAFGVQNATYDLAYSSLNTYLTNFLQQTYLITQASGSSSLGTLNPGVLNLANWTLNGVYIGTEDNGTGPVTSTSSKLGLEVSNLLLTTTTDAPTVGGSITEVAGSALPVTQPVVTSQATTTTTQSATTTTTTTQPATTTTTTTTPATTLTVLDTSMHASVTPATQSYTGPVTGLEQQYINVSTDNLNITSVTPGWFLKSGSGTDALSASSGTNVLDGGTGSNFLSGGTGTDTFFVDARGATADIWSTLANFHLGDTATMWGVSQGAFSITYVNGQGAAGYTGLTIHAAEANGPTASVTLAGYSQADITSGALSVSFGTDATSGSNYMMIHANAAA